ncbi:MAG TPA: hypothetical protein VKR30_08045 [Candidatus Limnocylindrales bacterium]|nr:hypothetical protein [Candidatus Limnocylindrales bacterium]
MAGSRAIIPTRCNIGAAELSRRRVVAIVLTGATAVVAVALLAAGLPHLARIGLWPFAAGAGVSWLQVTRRFCVRFGAQGVENFGPLGAEIPVDPAQRAADARRATLMILEGVLAGLVVTTLFVVLPL